MVIFDPTSLILLFLPRGDHQSWCVYVCDVALTMRWRKVINHHRLIFFFSCSSFSFSSSSCFCFCVHLLLLLMSAHLLLSLMMSSCVCVCVMCGVCVSSFQGLAHVRTQTWHFGIVKRIPLNFSCCFPKNGYDHMTPIDIRYCITACCTNSSCIEYSIPCTSCLASVPALSCLHVL